MSGSVPAPRLPGRHSPLFLTRALPAAAIIISAALGGFFAYGYLAGPRTLMATASAPTAESSSAAVGAAVSGDARVTGAANDAAPARALADALPDIPFADRRGVIRRLSDWKSHPLLVNFWAPWCGPCREETPLLERLSRQRAGDGLAVIGVAVDARPAVLDYAQRAGIQYPLLIGERPGLEAVRALGMEPVFPFSVFVDASGRIVTLKIGALRADQAKLILDRVDDLDRGRIDLATARRQIADGIARLAVAHARNNGGSRF